MLLRAADFAQRSWSKSAAWFFQNSGVTELVLRAHLGHSGASRATATFGQARRRGSKRERKFCVHPPPHTIEELTRNRVEIPGDVLRLQRT
eukprot:COSAG01_NODE_50208_length_365_cov_0.781955_1_plen_91_part_00